MIRWDTALALTGDAGAVEPLVRACWQVGRTAPVRCGTRWDAIRITRTLGLDALQTLQDADGLLGAWIDVPADGTVEALVPAGSARCWPALLGTCGVGHGTVRWPAPHLTRSNGTAAIGGRTWIIPPASHRLLTDADALCEAVAAATLHRARALSEQTPPATSSTVPPPPPPGGRQHH